MLALGLGERLKDPKQVPHRRGWVRRAGLQGGCAEVVEGKLCLPPAAPSCNPTPPPSST